jgi:hypothetical protein
MTGTHHHAQLFSVEMESHKPLLELAWNGDPPDLSLSSSYDYRSEPLLLAWP